MWIYFVCLVYRRNNDIPYLETLVIWLVKGANIFLPSTSTMPRGGGTPVSNGYGCKHRCKAHTSKGWGIRWEHNLKKWGVMEWEAKFWFKIRGDWVKMLLWPFISERFKTWAGIWKKKSSTNAKMISLSMELKQKVASCGSRMHKIESDRRAHIRT